MDNPRKQLTDNDIDELATDLATLLTTIFGDKTVIHIDIDDNAQTGAHGGTLRDWIREAWGW